LQRKKQGMEWLQSYVIDRVLRRLMSYIRQKT
jgi:hypothetical protein